MLKIYSIFSCFATLSEFFIELHVKLAVVSHLLATFLVFHLPEDSPPAGKCISREHSGNTLPSARNRRFSYQIHLFFNCFPNFSSCFLFKK